MSITASVDSKNPPANRMGWPWTEETDSSVYRKNVVYPKITIVTPSFNQGHFLEETIRSVLFQNYPNLEYIIIDGGSTDNSVDIIKKYEKQISFWISEKDKGQSDAINKGFRKATGEILNWLNSDDYYYPGTLAKIAHYFMDHPEVTVVSGKSRAFDENGKENILPASYIDNSSLQNTLVHAHIEQPSTFFRKTVCDKMGMLTEELHYLMDKEWWMKYLLNFGVAGALKTDELFVNFRMHSGSKTVSVNSKFNDDYASILRSMCGIRGLVIYVELLDLKYNTNKKYSFSDPALKNLDIVILEAMVIHFLLRWGHMIYSKRDFVHAKALLQKINFEKFNLDAEKKEWLDKLKKNTSSNWFTFRVKRKINWILKSKS